MRKKHGLSLVMLVALAVPSWPQAAGNTDELMGAALHEERVSGDLKKAIDGYRKVLAAKGVSRAQAAQAQYHIGVCYEKLGNQEARRAFESVVRNYGEQKDLVIQARARLAAMEGPASNGPRARLLWDDARAYFGRVSADGRYLSFPDFSTGELMIKDLISGAERRVTNKARGGKAEGEAENSAVSPDGMRVAFQWDAWDAEAVKERAYYQLRVIGADGAGERLLWKGAYGDVFCWSPDGKSIAASVSAEAEREAPAQLMLFGADSGEQRALRTKGRRQKAHVFFSPDGKWLAYDESVAVGDVPSVYVLPTDGSATETEVARNAQMMGWSPDGSSLLLSKERGSESALFLVPVSMGKVSGDMQPVHTASQVGAPLGVTPDGRLFYRADNQRVDGWLAGFDVNAGRLGQSPTRFVVDKLWARTMNDNEVKFSPDGKQLLWAELPNRVFIRSTSGERQVTVNAQMKEILRVEWSHDGSALLIAGAGTDGRNGLYRVDPASGAATLLTPNLGRDWMMAFVPSRDGQTIYYRTLAGKLAAYSVSSATERIIFDDFVRVPNISLSHDGRMLAIRSGGNLGVLDLASGQYKRLYTRDFATDSHVMFGLDWSADDKNVVVVASLSQPQPQPRRSFLWIFPVNGAPPIRQPMGGDFRGISISPDGKLAATVRVETHQQVWSLENFLPVKK